MENEKDLFETWYEETGQYLDTADNSVKEHQRILLTAWRAGTSTRLESLKTAAQEATEFLMSKARKDPFERDVVFNLRNALDAQDQK